MEKEITLNYLRGIQQRIAYEIENTWMDRRDQEIVNLDHDYMILERAIKIIEESEV